MGREREGPTSLDALSRLVFEQAAEGIVISRPADGVILEANEAWCRLMGYGRDEVIGRSTLELGLWVNPGERNAIIARVRQELAADGLTIAFRRKDGEVRTGEARARSIEIAGQELMVGSIRDITARIVEEEELERSRAELAAAQRVARIGSWTWDPETGRTAWSEEMCRMLELAPPDPSDTLEDVTPSLMERIHPGDRRAVQAWFDHSFSTGRADPIEHRIVCPDGSIRWVLAEASTEPSEEGRPGRYIGTVQDITERVQADEERRRLLSELVTVREEERQRIAVNIHDDSLQSLTAALLQVELLLEQDADPEHVDRMGHIERALREAISRLRRLTFELHPPALDRVSLAAATRDLALQEFEDLEVVTEIEDRTDRPLRTETRAVAYRIVQEALTNVRRHAQASAVQVLVETEAGILHVTVRDDGVGIDLALVGESPRRHLGLSSMRQRAELEGGGLEVGPAEGGGTLVEFWLPLAPHSPS